MRWVHSDVISREPVALGAKRGYHFVMISEIIPEIQAMPASRKLLLSSELWD
jgi:hypothetical protein